MKVFRNTICKWRWVHYDNYLILNSENLNITLCNCLRSLDLKYIYYLEILEYYKIIHKFYGIFSDSAIEDLQSVQKSDFPQNDP